MNQNSIPYALGAILLGATGLWFADFHLQWEPVPAGLPFRTLLAWANGLLTIIAGAAIVSGRGRGERVGAWLLTVFFALWVVVLHLPNAIQGWKHIGAWNAPAEAAFLMAGGLALAASHEGSNRAVLALVARLAAGVSAVVFGCAHFNYIDFTASMVPAWIPPSQAFWAWATGAGHLAAGIALLTGIQARLAATLLAVMMASFVVLLHLPRVLAHPEAHIEWIMLGISGTLAGSAWLVRKYAV